MQFSQIPGLEDTKTVLINAVEKNHVAHAQLFHGLEGSGALTMALAYATYLNCLQKNEQDSCGKCPSCMQMAKLAHPDVSYIYPTAGGKKVLSENFINQWRTFVAENPYGNISDWLSLIDVKQGNIPVEEARQLIQNLSLKSYTGGYKIVVIWLVEYLSIATANALLKVLEEPPPDTIFLLVCSNTDRLLTTIISRTQRIAIPKFQDKDIVTYLNQINYSEEAVNNAAILADGNLHKAQVLVEAKNDEEYDWFAQWMRYSYAFELSKLISLADEFDAFSKESQKKMLELGTQQFRNIFLFATGNSSLVKLPENKLSFIEKFSKVFKLGSLQPINNLLSEALFHIERNVRAKIVFLDLSIKLARILK